MAQILDDTVCNIVAPAEPLHRCALRRFHDGFCQTHETVGLRSIEAHLRAKIAALEAKLKSTEGALDANARRVAVLEEQIKEDDERFRWLADTGTTVIERVMVRDTRMVLLEKDPGGESCADAACESDLRTAIDAAREATEGGE